jgi:hypothetical protein
VTADDVPFVEVLERSFDGGRKLFRRQVVLDRLDGATFGLDIRSAPLLHP